MWMREVLVNSCHLELRIEDAEGDLLKLRRQALGPVIGEVQEMANSAKEERFESLCARTWENKRKANHEDQPALPSRETTIKFAAGPLHESEDSKGEVVTSPSGGLRGSKLSLQHGGISQAKTNAQKSPMAVTRLSENVSAEIQNVETNVAAVKQLLTDTRANAAAVICHQIREAEKTGGKHASKGAMEDGYRKLKLLVNEDFAKTTLKELQKSAPQGKFVF